MGFLDRFRGRREEKEEEVVPSAAAAPAHIDLDAHTHTNVSTPTLTDPAVAKAFQELSAAPRGRIYNPYEGLSVLDRRDGQRPAFTLPERPEFLFEEEATVHTRSWSENLTYYTGVGYLVGALAGGARGGYTALSTPLAVAAGTDSSRLRVNALLNGSGRAGRSSGNALGILGLFFSGFESVGSYLNSDGWVPDWVPTLAAGTLSGAIYRAPRGPRQAAAAGVVGLGFASALLGARSFVSPGL